MQRHIPAVTRAQYRLGVQASRRVGQWVASWEERGRQAREAKSTKPPPSRSNSR